MITISGKQNDNEVETSKCCPSHVDVHVSHRGIAEVKIFLPSWPALPDTPLGGPRHLQFFFSSSVQLPCGRARKMVQLVGMLVNQIQIHIMIHKLIHIFHAY